MKKTDYFIYYFLQSTWGIIQNILGFLIYLSILIKDNKRLRYSFKGSKVISWNSKYSMALGKYIFMGKVNKSYYLKVLSHEYGHTIQSCILGPLYLFVIGLPSLIWASNRHFNIQRNKGIYLYSDFYPEKWANYLGRKYSDFEPIDY